MSGKYNTALSGKSIAVTCGVHPKRTRLKSAVHFDTTPNNPNNPNPNMDVYWGDQTWDEMKMAFMRVALFHRKGTERHTDPTSGRESTERDRKPELC